MTRRTRRSRPQRPPSRVRLYRDKARGKVMGVCAGLADYSGLSLKGIRVAAIFGLIFVGVPVLIGYFLMGFLLPDRPRNLYKAPREEAFWRHVRGNPAGTARGLRHKFREIERRLRAAEACVTSPQFNLKREIDNL